MEDGRESSSLPLLALHTRQKGLLKQGSKCRCEFCLLLTSCRNSLYMGKRYPVIPKVSRQPPRDRSAATSHSWLHWKVLSLSRVQLKLPKRWPSFQVPRGTSGLCLSTDEAHSTLPRITVIGDCLVLANSYLYPQTYFLILLKLKKLLYVIANFTAADCCRVDNKPLDR